jgi:hypothetical protein
VCVCASVRVCVVCMCVRVCVCVPKENGMRNTKFPEAAGVQSCSAPADIARHTADGTRYWDPQMLFPNSKQANWAWLDLMKIRLHNLALFNVHHKLNWLCNQQYTVTLSIEFRLHYSANRTADVRGVATLTSLVWKTQINSAKCNVSRKDTNMRIGVTTEEMYEKPQGRDTNWHSKDILIYWHVYTTTQFWPAQTPVIQQSPHLIHHYCCGD